MGLLSEYGKSLSGQVIEVYQNYYKVISISVENRFYCVYRINFPWEWQQYREVTVGCPFDCDGKIVGSALRKYFDLFVP